MKRSVLLWVGLSFVVTSIIVASPPYVHAESNKWNLSLISAESIKWNLSLWGKERGWTRPVHQWAHAMTRQTDGKWQIKIHYGSVLSPAADNWEGIKSGKFEAAGVCMAYSPEKVPLHTVHELPFIAPERTRDIGRMWIALWEHPAMRKELLRWNAVPLLPAADTQNQLMGTKRVARVSDLSRLRIRVSADIGKVLNRFGASTVMLKPQAVYESLGSGSINMVAMPWTYAFGAYKVYQVSKYATNKISLGSPGCVFVANKDAWDALPKEFKKLHRKWYENAPGVWQDAFAESDKSWMRIFRKNLEIVDFPIRERNKLIVRAQEVYDAWSRKREKEGLPGKMILEYYLRKREKIAGK